MDRREVLHAAEKCICGDRQEAYGDASKDFSYTAGLWSAYKGIEFKVEDVPIMMMLVKISRIHNGSPKDDNWVDGIGYLALGSDVSEK